MSNATLNRQTFKTSRQLEYFTESELTKQIGHDPAHWPIAILKELIDNSIDACEMAGKLPEIEVTIEEDALSVRDNGPGLKEGTLRESLDYESRVSDKMHYSSPARGQLGNALMCVWAAPLVHSDRNDASIEILTNGKRFQIDVSLDHIEQKPKLQIKPRHTSEVKSGTLIRIEWSNIACYFDESFNPNFYSNGPLSARDLILQFAAFNPHATFRLTDPMGRSETFDRVWDDLTWKWLPDNPTSIHWYTKADLKGLIAANLSQDVNKTLHQFLQEFDNFSGSKARKEVLEPLGLNGATLQDLMDGEHDIDIERVHGLLGAMQDRAHEIGPKNLGVLGKEHFTDLLVNRYQCDPETVKYRNSPYTRSVAGGVPFLVEVAYGQVPKNSHLCQHVGVNFSPTLREPTEAISMLRTEARLERYDPAALLIHITYPRPRSNDAGKVQHSFPSELNEQLQWCFEKVTEGHKSAKKQQERENRKRQREQERVEKQRRKMKMGPKEACYRVLENAYKQASGNQGFAHNHQIWYQTRQRALQLIEKFCTKDRFTNILIEFQEDYPELTDNWDIVYDDRGTFIEPHTGTRVPLGTVSVRDYFTNWHSGRNTDANLQPLNFNKSFPTHGPPHRYENVLLVEKEGYLEILKKSNLHNKYDIALMTTKGYASTASRDLIQRLTDYEATTFVVRDFDADGFSIANSLKSDTERFQFENKPRVVDLGLRLKDARQMELQSERHYFPANQKKDPTIHLRECGATREECEFLVHGREDGQWYGHRIELNAMTMDQFIYWIEEKLHEYGVSKMIPNDEQALKDQWKRAYKHRRAEQELKKIRESIENEVPPEPPKDFKQRVRNMIDDEPYAWDKAIDYLVANELHEEQDS